MTEHFAPAACATGDVFLGYCDYGQWVPEFGECLADFFLHDSMNNRRIGGRCRAKGPYIPENRTRVVREFLKTGCEWLWFLDIDLAFPPQILDAMLDVASPDRAPIVGALYFSSYESTPAGTWWPMWLERQGDEEFCVVSKVQLGEVRPLTAAGTGCMLIHRGVLEKLGDLHADDPWPWFGHDVRVTSTEPQRAGEDVTFCARARAAGFSVWGLALPLRHFKTISVGWAEFADQFKEEPDAVHQGMLPLPSGPFPVDSVRNRAARRREQARRRAG